MMVSACLGSLRAGIRQKATGTVTAVALVGSAALCLLACGLLRASAEAPLIAAKLAKPMPAPADMPILTIEGEGPSPSSKPTPKPPKAKAPGKSPKVGPPTDVESIPPTTAKKGPFRPKLRTDISPEDRGCLPWSDIPDFDGDFKRNSKALASADLCLTYDAFEENGFFWVLQIIYSKTKRKGPLWAVPHDNENAGFDSAVHSVAKYGGTVVAVETGGQRNLRGTKGEQDPNRNFDVGEASRCKQQLAPSPEYTSRFLRWFDRSQPIIALHSNTPRNNVISIKQKQPFTRGFPASMPIGGKLPDNTLIFVASVADPAQDPNLRDFVRELNKRGIHVLYEIVSAARNDCSMSNYAALGGVRNYLNVEVVHGDTETQLRIVDHVMALLKDRPIGGLAPPTPPADSPKAKPARPPAKPKGGQ
jgi:hypothetical protein